LTPTPPLAITNVAVEEMMVTKQEELATKKDLGELEGRLTTQIGANATKIDANSEAISKLTSLALENKDDIKKMATREYMDKRLDDIVTGQDKMIKLYMNLDQERTATKARVDRIDGDVEKNKSKIRELEAKVAR
jgi:hypothetical protein